MQMPFYLYKFCRFPYPTAHFSGGYAVILRGKGNILSGGQSYKLAVGILQHRSRHFGNSEDIHPGIRGFRGNSGYKIRLLETGSGDPAHNSKRTFDTTGKSVGNQAVNTVDKRGLSRTRGTEDKDLFALPDLQIDVIKGRFGLGSILKGKVRKTESLRVTQF
jgi:hypothetical protein